MLRTCKIIGASIVGGCAFYVVTGSHSAGLLTIAAACAGCLVQDWLDRLRQKQDTSCTTLIVDDRRSGRRCWRAAKWRLLSGRALTPSPTDAPAKGTIRYGSS